MRLSGIEEAQEVMLAPGALPPPSHRPEHSGNRDAEANDDDCACNDTTIRDDATDRRSLRLRRPICDRADDHRRQRRNRRLIDPRRPGGRLPPVEKRFWQNGFATIPTLRTVND